MDFVYKIDTPITASFDSPQTTVAQLTRGRLVGGFLFFPSGPAGKLHFLIRTGVHQILPFNVGESYALDDCVVPLHFSLDLPEPPFHLDLITWNTSIAYPHSLTVALFLEPLLKRKWKLVDVINELQPTKGYRKP